MCGGCSLLDGGGDVGTQVFCYGTDAVGDISGTVRFPSSVLHWQRQKEEVPQPPPVI